MNIEIEIKKEVNNNYYFNFTKQINDLLEIIPEAHLRGLQKIRVLLEPSMNINKDVSGVYLGYSVNNAMIIELYARNIFLHLPWILFYLFPIAPKLLLANTLFHEVGHHYQNISHGFKKERWELNAEQYSNTMTKKFFFQTGVFKIILLFKFIVIPFLRRYKRYRAKRNSGKL